MTQKSLLHAVAAQIANGYETAEVPMYSEQLPPARCTPWRSCSSSVSSSVSWSAS